MFGIFGSLKKLFYFILLNENDDEKIIIIFSISPNLTPDLCKPKDRKLWFYRCHNFGQEKTLVLVNWFLKIGPVAR